jgi:hypothetical protein
MYCWWMLQQSGGVAQWDVLVRNVHAQVRIVDVFATGCHAILDGAGVAFPAAIRGTNWRK